MTIQEIEQELFEMERKLKSMFNSCSKDLAIGIEKLRGELAELKESKKEGKWKPAYKEKYWIRDDGGEIGFDNWTDHEIDVWRYNNLPMFKTKEECERYWHFMDTVKEKSYEFSKEEWEDERIDKYEIEYNSQEKMFRVDVYNYIKFVGGIYFKEKSNAQYIIDNFKDELMEYWI